MDNLFLGTYIIWLISEVVLNRTLRSNKTDKQDTDQHSLLIIWVVVVFAIIIAILISMNFIYTITNGKYARYAGLVIMLASIMLRITAVITLGKFFTVDVTIRQGHQLVKRGLYKFLRHPSYTASLLTFIGFGISLNNWLSLALITAVVIIVFRMRIRIEEKALTDQFGDQYLQYKKEAWGLLPFMH